VIALVLLVYLKNLSDCTRSEGEREREEGEKRRTNELKRDIFACVYVDKRAQENRKKPTDNISLSVEKTPIYHVFIRIRIMQNNDHRA
jgi:hypothetical protein